MNHTEFVLGAVFRAGPRLVAANEIMAFARLYDPQPFHVDPVEAAKTPWGGLIASGWMTCGVAMQLVAQHVLRDAGSIGSPGVEELRWPNPVRPGDELSVTVTVLESRASASKPLQIVRWRWEVMNQKKVTVLSLIATSFFQREIQHATQQASPA